MAEQDLSRLRIDRTAPRKRSGRRLVRWLIALMVVGLGAGEGQISDTKGFDQIADEEQLDLEVHRHLVALLFVFREQCRAAFWETFVPDHGDGVGGDISHHTAKALDETVRGSGGFVPGVPEVGHRVEGTVGVVEAVDEQEFHGEGGWRCGAPVV